MKLLLETDTPEAVAHIGLIDTAKLRHDYETNLTWRVMPGGGGAKRPPGGGWRNAPATGKRHARLIKITT